MSETPVQSARVFVALQVAGQLGPKADELFCDLKRTIQGIRWVRPEARHLTLKFLGDTPVELIPKLTEELTASASGHKPFEIRLAGLGGFPRVSRARVIWVGITEGQEELKQLARTVDQSCGRVGCRGDRKPFSPHLTLGRAVSDPVRVHVPNEVFKAEWGRIPIDGFDLVKSTLQPGGRQYESLAEIPLGGGLQEGRFMNQPY